MIYHTWILVYTVKLAWHSGCVMDCHTTARGSIPGWNGVTENRASCPSHGTVNGVAVSKWPRCRWDAKHNQPTNLVYKLHLISSIKNLKVSINYAIMTSLKSIFLISNQFCFCQHFRNKKVPVQHNLLWYEDSLFLKDC